MSAGEATHLITIEALHESKAESGYPKATWQTIETVFAKKENVSGRERFTANQTSSPYDATFEIPYLASMDPDDHNIPKVRRIVFRGRVYDITAAKLVGWHRTIVLEALAGGTVR